MSLCTGAFRGGYKICERGGGGGGGGGGELIYKTRCRRQCIEARSVDQSARSVENFIRPSFISDQDELSWHFRALHCKFLMNENCRSRAGRHVLAASCCPRCRPPKHSVDPICAKRGNFSSLTVIFQSSRWALVAPLSCCTTLTTFWFPCHP